MNSPAHPTPTGLAQIGKHALALLALGQCHAPASLTELAQILDQQPRCVAQHLDWLVGAGLAARQQPEGRGAAPRFALTEAGQDRLLCQLHQESCPPDDPARRAGAPEEQLLRADAPDAPGACAADASGAYAPSLSLREKEREALNNPNILLSLFLSKQEGLEAEVAKLRAAGNAAPQNQAGLTNVLSVMATALSETVRSQSELISAQSDILRAQSGMISEHNTAAAALNANLASALAQIALGGGGLAEELFSNSLNRPVNVTPQAVPGAAPNTGAEALEAPPRQSWSSGGQAPAVVTAEAIAPQEVCVETVPRSAWRRAKEPHVQHDPPPSGELPPEDDPLVLRLRSLGVYANLAKSLVGEYEGEYLEEKINRYIFACEQGRARGIGYLIDSIRYDYPALPGYQPRQDYARPVDDQQSVRDKYLGTYVCPRCFSNHCSCEEEEDDDGQED